MDTDLVSTFTDKMERLVSRCDELESKLQSVLQNQDVHSEIQLETAKLLQNIQGQQLACLDRLGDVVDALDETSGDGDPKEEIRALSAFVAQESRQRALDLSVLKQTSNLTLRQSTGGKLPVRCIFLVHSIPMWDALSDVYSAMKEDERFDPIVISVGSTPLGRGAFEGEDKVSKALESMEVQHLRFNMDNSYAALDILKALRPAVIFRQQQWDACLPPAFHTHELTFARLCLVPYALNLVSSLGDPIVTDVSALGFDQPYHRAAWRVFCETSVTQTYFQSFQHSDPDKFVLSGYPKFDRLLKSRESGAWPIPPRKDRAFRIVWAPHYSVGTGGLGFGVFDKIWQDMIKWAAEAKDIDFVLKPHPALLGQVLSGDNLKAFRKVWTDMPNCAIEEEQYGALFAASDLMISDGVSFLAEYQLFEKPIIFFDSGHHLEFNALGKLAEAATCRVHTFDQLKKEAIEHKNGKLWKYEAERKILLDSILPNAGGASASILSAIVSGILNEHHE